MRLQILIDNRQDMSGRLFSEHGLCILMWLDGCKILVDTGLTGRAMLNAEALGIDIGMVDWLILSHGHRDHTGGLGAFVERNGKSGIVSCNKINVWDYTSDSHGHRHSLNPDRAIIERCRDRFVFLDDEVWELVDGGCHVWVGRCRRGDNARPGGNRLLHVDGVPYNGEDELIVSVVEGDRHTVVSPCSHSGVGNIIECAEKRTGKRVDTFVGGLHYIDGEDCGGMECLAPIDKIYTGHCTGDMAKERLGAMLGDRLRVFATGDVIYC